jgi:hypothetical protein
MPAASSLGTWRQDVRPPPRESPAARGPEGGGGERGAAARQRRRTCTRVAAPLVALPLILVVSFGVRQSHDHPHVDEQRALQRTNVLCGVLLAYLTLESISPLALALVSKLESPVMRVGIHCDLVAALSFASACLVPIQMFDASGDISVRRAHLIVVYVGFALLIVVRSVAFVNAVRSVVADAQ